MRCLVKDSRRKVLWKIAYFGLKNHLLTFLHTGLLIFFFLFSILIILVMNDPLEHATGLEKRELLAKAAGNDNPFDMRVLKRGPGTKDTPNLIPSAFDARLVGCICEYIL